MFQILYLMEYKEYGFEIVNQSYNIEFMSLNIDYFLFKDLYKIKA